MDSFAPDAWQVVSASPGLPDPLGLGPGADHPTGRAGSGGRCQPIAVVAAAATIPLATRDALRCGKLKKGDLVLFAAVGAGYTVGANLWRWQM